MTSPFGALPVELQRYAASQIASILGLPEEDAGEIAKSMAELASERDVLDWVGGFLGDTKESTQFAKEFSRRRFNPVSQKTAPRPSMKPQPKQSQQQSRQQQNQQQQQQQQQQWTNLPGVKVVNRKNEVEEEFYRPKKSTPRPESSTPPPPVEPPKPSPPPPTTADPAPPKPKPQPKSKKGNDDSKVVIKSNRRPCTCLAARHALFANCLTCGRIICAQEGPGPCFTCSTPVLSRGQQLELLAQRLHNKNVQSDSALTRAAENRDKMLQFQRESAQRTRIHDAAADFDPNAVVTDRWASKEEREKAILKLKEEKRREEEKRRVRVVDLDLGKLTLSEGKLPQEEDKPKRPVIPTNRKMDEPEEGAIVAQESSQDQDRGERIRRNPNLVAPPVFIPSAKAPPPRAKKHLIWEKKEDKEDAAPAPQKNLVRVERKAKGGKWSRIQHELAPGGVDFEFEAGGLDEEEGRREGTETDCG